MKSHTIALLEVAREARISVTAEGDQLCVRGPRSASGIMLQLHEHKAEILTMVRLPDAVAAQSAPLSHTPTSSQASDITARVFNAAKSCGFPRLRLPDGRICKGADRWRMFTTSNSTTKADLMAVLPPLVALADVRDSPDREGVVDVAIDVDFWPHALAVARYHLPDAVPALESLRARGTQLFRRGNVNMFGPYDDFTDSEWTNAADWRAEYVAVLGDHRLQWEDILANIVPTSLHEVIDGHYDDGPYVEPDDDDHLIGDDQ